jgi:hypothetical protein
MKKLNINFARQNVKSLYIFKGAKPTTEGRETSSTSDPTNMCTTILSTTHRVQ